MSWVLFFQIEVIIMTCGLVAVFVCAINQSAKDHSFNSRVQAMGKILESAGNEIAKYATNGGHRSV